MLIITTGGTIEGLDYDNPGQAPLALPMPLETLLERIANLPELSIKRVFCKDSRFITDRDRAILALEIENTDKKKILITHGTFSMVETARYLGVCNFDKAVVLTGALVPGTNLHTDAVDNLSFAIQQLRDLEKGVYIAIHGEIFTWNNVKKNTENNRFERL